MVCSEARHLLAQNVIPGSTRGRNPVLGFHLASCEQCRAYRAQRDQLWLADLVAAELPSGSPPARPQAPARPASRNSVATVISPSTPAPGSGAGSFHRPKFPVRHVLLVAAAGLVICLLWVSWYLALPVYRAAYRDMASWNTPPPTKTTNVVLAALPDTTSVLLLPTTSPTPTLKPSPTLRPTITSTPIPTPTATQQPVQAMTVLLLGLDARPGEGLHARSDALLLVRLDPQGGDAAVLSMPRDLWVPIPGYGENKVNAAFYYGERAQAGGGILVAKQAVGSAFNVPIDYAVAVDFAGFRSLIDAIGGITVDVPKEIYDGRYPTDDYGYTVAHFLPGTQQMDGSTALMYARTRHADSDFERIKRQQLVLLGIAQRLKERSTLQNLHEADVLTAALTPYIHTDMPPELVLSTLWQLRDVDPASARRYTVNGAVLSEGMVGGAYALIPQPGALPSLGQQLLTPAP